MPASEIAAPYPANDDGDELTFAPVRRDWQSFADDAPPVDEDFMADRQDLFDARRVRL